MGASDENKAHITGNAAILPATSQEPKQMLSLQSFIKPV